MDLKQTKRYYDSMKPTDICPCAYCQNYVKAIKKSYPDLDRYLASLGIDVQKPFETMPSEVDRHGKIEYFAVQYLVLGDKAAFQETSFSGIQVKLAKDHPATGLEGDHFVIEIYPIVLEWVIHAKPNE